MEHVALFAVGLALLAVGAPLLVFGAARLDRRAGRSPFAVGVVAVAFGPCVAGLAFDLAAVLRPAPRLVTQIANVIVVGNVVGGNIASVGLVLGAAALVRPVAATARLFSTAVPLAFGATLLFWFLARNSPLSRVDAGFLLAALAPALVLLIRAARRESDDVKAAFAAWVPGRMPMWVAALLALAGLAATVGGAMLAAEKLIDATRAMRLTAPAMGATVVAFGTSLPALVAAVVASRRGRSDLVLGIVVGSVLFNLLLVGGVAMVEPLLITKNTILEAIPAMALFALLLLPVLLNGLTVPRWEGALLLAAYAGFVTWQVMWVR